MRSIASGALERVDNPAAWLYRGRRNAVVDHYRTRRRHDSLDDDRWPDPETPDGEPNDATRELSCCLLPLLHQLSPAARGRLLPASRRRRRNPSSRPTRRASPSQG